MYLTVRLICSYSIKVMHNACITCLRVFLICYLKLCHVGTLLYLFPSSCVSAYCHLVVLIGDVVSEYFCS